MRKFVSSFDLFPSLPILRFTSKGVIVGSKPVWEHLLNNDFFHIHIYICSQHGQHHQPAIDHSHINDTSTAINKIGKLQQ